MYEECPLLGITSKAPNARLDKIKIKIYLLSVWSIKRTSYQHYRCNDMTYDYVTNMRNMNEMRREYELWEYINTTLHSYCSYTACHSTSVSIPLKSSTLRCALKTLFKTLPSFTPWYIKELHPYVIVLNEGCADGFTHLVLHIWFTSLKDFPYTTVYIS